MSGYDVRRRSPRAHRRVVRVGNERSDGDIGIDGDFDFAQADGYPTRSQRDADDDRRILSELPPHWGMFSERGR